VSSINSSKAGENPLNVPIVPTVEELDEWFDLENLSGNTARTKNRTAILRRKARSVALQALFEVDATDHDPYAVLERHILTYNLPEEIASFARLLVDGVTQQHDNIDPLISKAAPSWPIEQMPKIDKNILRLAIFEILFNNDVPTKAAIDEAIELAKNFGSDSSSSFVNGVLGAIVTQNQNKVDELEATKPETVEE
jgi:transcription antitermination protein NusB